MEPPRGYTESMLRLWEAFAQMPGIGRRTAERLTYYVLECSNEEAQHLAQAVRDVKEKVRACSVCFNIAEQDPCKVCSDARRDRSTLCVVEEPKDVLAIESTGRYRGLYHVLLGRIAPLDGVGPDRLTVGPLEKRVREGGVKEVILATNPNVEGDATALYIAERIGSSQVKVTRLARGLPAGGSLQHAGPTTLGDAIDGRRLMRQGDAP
jgi:recombination protein RecR